MLFGPQILFRAAARHVQAALQCDPAPPRRSRLLKVARQAPTAYHRPSCNHQPQSLPRVLGPWMATAIVVGTVIGSGVFKKGRNVAENVPEFGLAMSVWVLGGVLALLGALALAEVAVLFPRAGGNYVFLREGYGRMAGFLWGWVEFWIIRSASIAALATMFTESFHDVLKQSLHPGQSSSRC